MRARVAVFISMTAVAIGAIAMLFLYRPISHVEPEQNVSDERLSNYEGPKLPPPTISRETTFVTEPVGDDGYIDYFAALNQTASAGVTVENNAAVLFAMAGIGPAGFESPQREQFCQLLGISPSDVIQNQFQAWNTSTNGDETDLQQASSSPWSAEQFPRIASWVKANTESLDLVIEGTKRPRCYVPLVPPNLADGSGRYGKLVNALLPAQQMSRDVCRCLAVRAMLRLSKSEVVHAQKDLLACHRLGRLIGSTPLLICGLVGYAIDEVARKGDVAVLRYGQLNFTLASAYLRELQQLPPLPDTAEKLNFADRINVLDMLTTIERNPGERFQFSTDASDEEKIANLRTMYDETLRVCNERFDQFVDAQNIPIYASRMTTMEKLTEELRKTLPPRNNPANPRALEDFQAKTRAELQGHPPEEVGRVIGTIQISLLFPNLENAAEAEVRGRVRESMIILGFALAAYHADNAEFPKDLDALVPDYVSALPKDLYNDRGLNYLREGNGYSLSSVGKDGIGHPEKPGEVTSTSDDIILQIP